MPREALSNCPRVCSSWRPIWVMTVSKLDLRSPTARAVWACASSRKRSIWESACCAWAAGARGGPGRRRAGGGGGGGGADLLGAALGGGQRVLHHAGVGPHHVVEVRALGVDCVQEADDGLVPVLQDRVDLGVRRIERLGRGEDRLSLILEALRQVVDLLQQPARHV